MEISKGFVLPAIGLKKGVREILQEGNLVMIVGKKDKESILINKVERLEG